MEDRPLKSVFFHFRFKFLAITAIFFLLWVILSSSMDFDQFANTLQFKLLGLFFVGAGILYLLFRKLPIKCPHCHKSVSTRKNWHCPHCDMMQGKDRYLSDKCLHCRQMLATSFCEHCQQEFKL